MIDAPTRCLGYSLVELSVALFLSSLGVMLLLMLAQLLLIGSQARAGMVELDRSLALAGRFLTETLESAGYRPEPWKQRTVAWVAVEPTVKTRGNETLSDRITVRELSDSSCTGQANLDESGKPRFLLLERSLFTENGALRLTCDYGPEGGPGTRQINGLALVEGIETLRVNTLHRTEADAERRYWKPADENPVKNGPLAVRIGLIAHSSTTLYRRTPRSLRLLGEWLPVPEDGKLRRTMTIIIPLTGRS